MAKANRARDGVAREGTDGGARRALCALVGLLLSAGALACDDPEDRRIRVAGAIYEDHCSRCHGSIEAGEAPQEVRGTGMEAPDLRTLEKRWGAPLDRDRVARFIDGRAEVAAHGTRTMPVWGDRLYADWPESDNREQAREGTVQLLVEYLESVQVE